MDLKITGYNSPSYIKPSVSSRGSRIAFCAHPDFYALRKNYDVVVSSYFRRGQRYGSPCNEFIDIVHLFGKIFHEPFIKPQKMLIAGIGESQEVFSYLAVIKNMIKQADIRGAVDLNIVDLQSKPSNKKLIVDSFFDQGYQPDRFVAQSFVKDTTDYGQSWYKEYRVKDDIFEFVKDTYKDKNKSKWNTRIQEAIKNYDNESFDIISANNTLGYLKTKDIIAETIIQMYRCLKSGGYLITDPYENYLSYANLYGKMEYFRDGIYKKL